MMPAPGPWCQSQLRGASPSYAVLAMMVVIVVE